MNIEIAKTSGFCFGIKRAFETIENCLQKYRDQNIYTLGPLIHNPQVVHELEKKGVKVLDNLDFVDKGVVIIRTHGVPKYIYNIASEKGIILEDATCPFVKKVQNIAYHYSKNSYKIVIVGDPEHPEVIGVKGWCLNNSAIVVSKQEDINKIPRNEKICVVAQTTITEKLWEDIINLIKKEWNSAVFFNTICRATSERQTEAEQLAQRNDAVLVLGSLKSSNTKKLVEVCKRYCNKVFLIEFKEDIPYEELKDLRNIGIIAGASTPYSFIEIIKKELMNNLSK